MSLNDVLVLIAMLLIIGLLIRLLYRGIEIWLRIPADELSQSFWLAAATFVVAYSFGVIANTLSGLPTKEKFGAPLFLSGIIGIVILLVQLSGVYQAQRLSRFIDIYRLRSRVRRELIPFAQALIDYAVRRLSDMQKKKYSLGYTELLTFYVTDVFDFLEKDSRFKAAHKRIDEWAELFYREYFESNKVALARGIEIQRVFILREDEKNPGQALDTLKKHWNLCQQYKKQYMLYATRKDLIPEHLDKNYAMINESVLMSESETETMYTISTGGGTIKAFGLDFSTLRDISLDLTKIPSFFTDFQELIKALKGKQQNLNEVENPNDSESSPH